MAPNDFIGVPQLLRVTLPVSTRPDPHNGYSTGIGDLNLFDIFLLKTEGVQLGVGPQITAPTPDRRPQRRRLATVHAVRRDQRHLR
ncbi:hypothetical protein PS726_05447 [Pseudomonas fluorescens]|nr:hypothetical protein PS861_04676 [Pseudomonas fluorescens]VVO36970.1 hypothetical protein PS726_05447 [Pseudomonas fluorescens]